MGTCLFSFVPASEMNGFAALCTLVMMLHRPAVMGPTSHVLKPPKLRTQISLFINWLSQVFFF